MYTYKDISQNQVKRNDGCFHWERLLYDMRQNAPFDETKNSWKFLSKEDLKTVNSYF